MEERRAREGVKGEQKAEVGLRVVKEWLYGMQKITKFIKNKEYLESTVGPCYFELSKETKSS